MCVSSIITSLQEEGGVRGKTAQGGCLIRIKEEMKEQDRARTLFQFTADQLSTTKITSDADGIGGHLEVPKDPTLLYPHSCAITHLSVGYT